MSAFASENLRFYGMSPIFRVPGTADAPPITDNDNLPVLTSAAAIGSESGDGTTTSLDFTVSLSPASASTVTVEYATADVTATGGTACATDPSEAGPDYISTSGTLTFDPGVVAATVTVTVCDDRVEDTGDQFFLEFSNPSNAVIDEALDQSRVPGFIFNTETSTEISIVADSAYAEEGAEAVFTLTRDGDAADALTVPVFVTEDGAVLGTEVPAHASFAPGARVAELRVPTDDDEVDEADGTVTARVVTGFAWVAAEGAASAAVTVLDNDDAPAGEAPVETVWQGDMSVIDKGNGAIGAHLPADFSNVSSTAGLEARWLWYFKPTRKLYLAFSDAVMGVEGMKLHFGDDAVQFQSTDNGSSSFNWPDVDVDWSDGETVAVRVVKPLAIAGAGSNDATLGTLSVAGATLSPAFDAGVRVYTATVDDGTTTVTVTAEASDDGATVSFGPAADADEDQEGHQVAVGSGETLIEVTVTAEDGATRRDYRVVASPAPEPVAVSFGVSEHAATEGGEPAVVAVSLAADPGRTVTVPLVATPEGGAGAEDYEAALEVTFEHGAGRTQTVTVTAVEDESAEDGERVVLGFGTLPEGLVAGETSSVTVALVDAPSNAAPEGKPLISGTPFVGETLTASADGIEDADGLTGASHAWQWLSNDGSQDTDIPDATGPTYTLTEAQDGKTVKVQVSFTDDGGTEETLVSKATSEVTIPLRATFEDVPDEHYGSGVFTFRVRFNLTPRVSFRVLKNQSFEVDGGKVKKARRVDGQDALREIHVAPSGYGDVTVTLPGGRTCGTTGAICTADGKALWNTETATVVGPPALRVADARAEEGTDETLDFVVSLSRVASGTVTVAYATSPGSADADADYTHTEGTLTFAAGETEKTVPVPVLDDEHDENEETLTLTLSNPSGAWIEDGEATGTIENSDPMPKAWLARFGRTVSEQVLEAVSDRLSAPREAGFRARLGGQELSFGGAAASGAEPGGGDGRRGAARDPRRLA